MHKLLARQLRRHFGDAPVPDGLASLLAEVDAAYAVAERDRLLLERSLELTSEELVARNHQLRVDLDRVEGMRVELAAKETLIRSFLDNAPSLMGIAQLLDDDVRFVVANPAVTGLFGADVHGSTLIGLGRPPAEVAAWRFRLGACTFARGPVRDEDLLPTPQGPRWLASVALDLGAHPGGHHVLFVLDDVTERRGLEHRLNAGERLASVGRLAAGVAHEINNPLASVVANLEVLSRRLATAGLPDQDEVTECVSDARVAAERVRRIVRDLKLLARPDDEAVEEVDLHALLDSSAKMAAHEIRLRATLVKEYGPVPRLYCNGARLGQVFLNLVVNAAHAIPVGRVSAHRIVLRTRVTRSGTVEVEVEDTGAGVAPELLPRLFDPFFTTKAAGVGSGIGLTICQGIVTDLGGRISVRSEPGLGTTFTVELPATAPPPLAPIAVPEPALVPPQVGARILVVDDEDLVCRLLRRMLSEHVVVAVTSARAALERLDAGEAFDLLLCDIMMPDVTGWELCAELERRGCHLARTAIFMTGGTLGAAGADLALLHRRSIEKPFDPVVLRDAVSRALLEGRATPQPVQPRSLG